MFGSARDSLCLHMYFSSKAPVTSATTQPGTITSSRAKPHSQRLPYLVLRPRHPQRLRNSRQPGRRWPNPCSSVSVRARQPWHCRPGRPEGRRMPPGTSWSALTVWMGGQHRHHMVVGCRYRVGRSIGAHRRHSGQLCCSRRDTFSVLSLCDPGHITVLGRMEAVVASIDISWFLCALLSQEGP